MFSMNHIVIALLSVLGIFIAWVMWPRKAKPVTAVETIKVNEPKIVTKPRLTEEQIKDAVLFLLKTQRSAPDGLSARAIQRRLNRRGLNVSRGDVKAALYRLNDGQTFWHLSRRGRELFQSC
jgi:hypothetical protein